MTIAATAERRIGTHTQWGAAVNDHRCQMLPPQQQVLTDVIELITRPHVTSVLASCPTNHNVKQLCVGLHIFVIVSV